jgi:hypothetical protein
MRKEKPKKRLVGWKQYFGKTATGILGRSGAGTFLAGGRWCFWLLFFFICSCRGRPPHPVEFAQRYLLDGLCVLGALMGLRGAKALFKRVEYADLVENAGRLPMTATLVRASNLLPSDQQAGLLRAARQGIETPPEQMLRATQEDRQSV